MFEVGESMRPVAARPQQRQDSINIRSNKSLAENNYQPSLAMKSDGNLYRIRIVLTPASTCSSEVVNISFAVESPQKKNPFPRVDKIWEESCNLLPLIRCRNWKQRK